MQVLVIINKDGITINADVHVKIWLIKEYVIKDLFEIQIIVNVNVINQEKNVDKLFEELSENSDENIMTNVTLSDHKNVCGSCKVYIFFFFCVFNSKKWNWYCFYLFSLVLNKWRD